MWIFWFTFFKQTKYFASVLNWQTAAGTQCVCVCVCVSVISFQSLFWFLSECSWSVFPLQWRDTNKSTGWGLNMSALRLWESKTVKGANSHNKVQQSWTGLTLTVHVKTLTALRLHLSPRADTRSAAWKDGWLRFSMNTERRFTSTRCICCQYWQTQDVWGAGAKIVKRAPGVCCGTPVRKRLLSTLMHFFFHQRMILEGTLPGFNKCKGTKELLRAH